MPSFLEKLQALDLPRVPPPTIPDSVIMVADRLGLAITLTSPSAPQQYEITQGAQASGYIRVRWGGMSVDYPDAGDEELYEGSADGFGAFTDDEREAKLLLALGLIAARILRG